MQCAYPESLFWTEGESHACIQVAVDDMKSHYTKVFGTIRGQSRNGKPWRCSREASEDHRPETLRMSRVNH
jgi:hypothetical protein